MDVVESIVVARRGLTRSLSRTLRGVEAIGREVEKAKAALHAFAGEAGGSAEPGTRAEQTARFLRTGSAQSEDGVTGHTLGTTLESLTTRVHEALTSALQRNGQVFRDHVARGLENVADTAAQTARNIGRDGRRDERSLRREASGQTADERGDRCASGGLGHAFTGAGHRRTDCLTDLVERAV